MWCPSTQYNYIMASSTISLHVALPHYIIYYRTRPFTVYGGHHRESHAYTSLSNSLELRVVPGRMIGKDAYYFMFKYEGIFK